MAQFLDTPNVHEAFRKDVLLHSWKETGVLVPWSTPELERLRDSSTVPGPSGEYHDYGEVGDVFGQPAPSAKEETPFAKTMAGPWLDPRQPLQAEAAIQLQGPDPLAVSDAVEGVPSSAITRGAQFLEVPFEAGEEASELPLLDPDVFETWEEARESDRPRKASGVPGSRETEIRQFALGSQCGRGVGYSDHEMQMPILGWSYRWRVYYPSSQQMEPGESIEDAPVADDCTDLPRVVFAHGQYPYLPIHCAS